MDLSWSFEQGYQHVKGKKIIITIYINKSLTFWTQENTGFYIDFSKK